MQSSHSRKLPFKTAFAALIFSGILMGFSPVFVREAEVGAFASAFWRVSFALPLLAIWAWAEPANDSKSGGNGFPLTAIIAGACFAGDLTFWHLSILNTTMANATFTVCLSAVWVAIFSNLTLGEPIAKRSWLGLAICLIGVALLINGTINITPENLIGDIYGIITSVFLGAYMLAMRSARRTMSSGTLFFKSTAVTAAILFFVAIVSGEAMLAETTRGWASLFSLGVFTHVGGQGLVTIALGSLSAMFSSLVIFIEALAAAFFGWWWFDETMSRSQMLGGCCIFLGIWLCRPEEA